MSTTDATGEEGDLRVAARLVSRALWQFGKNPTAEERDLVHAIASALAQARTSAREAALEALDKAIEEYSNDSNYASLNLIRDRLRSLRGET